MPQWWPQCRPIIFELQKVLFTRSWAKSLSEWYTVYPVTGIILDMGSANVNRRYIVTSSLIDRANVGAIVYDYPCANEVTLKNKWLNSTLLTRKLTTQGSVCYIFPHHDHYQSHTNTLKHANTHTPPPPPPPTPTSVSNVSCVYLLYSLQHREWTPFYLMYDRSVPRVSLVCDKCISGICLMYDQCSSGICLV